MVQAKPNAWVSVDLGSGWALYPTHYCLRTEGYVGDGPYAALRNWRLEGVLAIPFPIATPLHSLWHPPCPLLLPPSITPNEH